MEWMELTLALLHFLLTCSWPLSSQRWSGIYLFVPRPDWSLCRFHVTSCNITSKPAMECPFPTEPPFYFCDAIGVSFYSFRLVSNAATSCFSLLMLDPQARGPDLTLWVSLISSSPMTSRKCSASPVQVTELGPSRWSVVESTHYRNFSYKVPFATYHGRQRPQDHLRILLLVPSSSA